MWLCSYPEFFAIKHPILLICRSLQISLCIYSLSSYSWVKASLNMWFSFIYPWSFHLFATVQSLSRVWLCGPMNHSTPGLPVHYQLPDFTQTHVHRVSNANQPSHPLSSPSPPAPNPSQQQDLFQWVNSLHEVAKVLEFQLQHQSFQWTPRTDLL